MRVKYYLNSVRNGARIVLEYNSEEYLVAFNVEGSPDPAQMERVYKMLPLRISELKAMAKKGVAFKKVQEDLSFERFWKDYANKVGKKTRAKKLWEDLSEVDKIACLNSIPTYKSWLRVRTVEQCYPETYLSQRRWENEYQ